MSGDIEPLDSLLFVSVKQGEIVKRYTPQEWADEKAIHRLYLSACNFGNGDVERRRELCRRIVSDR